MDDTSYPSRPSGVALSRSKDANLTCATPGAGSIAQLVAELFAHTADIKLAP
jgi:tripartite-type tricarboxylate transporter receptor subunit TctC